MLNAHAGGSRDNTIRPADLAALQRTTALLDSTKLSLGERLRLTKELANIRLALQAGAPLGERLKLVRRLAEIRVLLLASAPASDATPPTPAPAPAPAAPAEPAEVERKSTSQFFNFDPNRKPAQRKRENARAMDLLRQIDAGQLDPAGLSDEEKADLAKYSGTGGNLVGADGKKGSAYEYYTPKPIAEGMWNLLRELGFQGGRTLDPSGGTGIFGSTAPVNAAVDSIELNATSGRVSQLVNDGPGFRTTVAPFEQVAAATPDETYDVVITNVPFGGVEDRGGNQYKDTKYRHEPLQNYFILRSLEKLRPGGLAAFITPPRCVSGKGGKEQELRERVSYMAEFMGAYRLPNAVFGTASADTITDVIVFRKFSREVLDKIAELREQNPAVLTQANVCWPEFIEGDYFRGEGRRFILGEFVAKDPTKFRDVDRVVNNGSITDIARLLRKFPDSRIRWDVLDAAETSPIVYRDGDTMVHAGQTMELQGGRWVVIKPAGSEEAAAELAESLARLSTPLGAVNASVPYADAARVQQALQDSGRALEVPDWLRGLLAELAKLPDGSRAAAWNAAIVGLAIDQAMEERQAEETGFDYLQGYPILSEAMRLVLADAKSPAPALSKKTKTAMKKVAIHYDRSTGYSGVWRGDVVQAADTRDLDQRFEAARYLAGGGDFVPMDEARRLYGEDFDPFEDDDWCVSADGQAVARADDYFVGNYGDFLARIDAELAAATTDELRDKLLRQKIQAQHRLQRADTSTMTFTLFSPFVTVEERVEFLRRFVDPRFTVALNENTGKPEVHLALVGEPKNTRDKLLKRLALHLNGTRLTLGGIAVADEAAALRALREMAATAESQFSAWVKANPVIMGRLQEVANDPQRIYFRQVDDETKLNIPGLNPDWEVHGYQAAEIRKKGRDFSGINGFGVGLGKTSTALVAVQHAQSIGVKKRTMIVVPNSVLSNWRKESGRVYASTSGCLYVGLVELGDDKFKTDPSRYDADLTRVLEGRFSKIFVTYEAFQRLRLRDTTAQEYDTYLASVDRTYADSDKTAEAEKGKSKRAKLIDLLTSDSSKSLAAPFFEDLGIDSLVIDEAHLLKNSRGAIEFSGGKFLSLAEPSARGIDGQAKAWWVRKGNVRKDGVMLLTATPITNSPLEIYSMLSLAVGDAKLNDLMVGIKGADQFMEVMCQMENRDEETLDGKIKPYDVFVGLNNVNVLRNALGATATIKEAADVGAQIVMPDAEERQIAVALPERAKSTLIEYKQAFRFAIDTLSGKKDVGGSQEAYERVAAKFGEPMNLIGHPFNLINKMSALIADPELDERATFYTISPAQAEKAAAVAAAWNKKPPIEDRPRPGPHTDRTAIVGKKIKKDGEDEIELLKVQVQARVLGERIVLDTMDHETQADFEAAAEKAGLDLDVTVPPKLAALVSNFQFEEANPRGRVEGLPSGRVRQLIFCDTLALHNKIKRLLVKRCGVPARSIAIITGKVNGKPEQILAVQDGFNAEGDDNVYRVVIANEKAEVGINLQKGTQAIHHLTLGWTPDSLTQRNGRGVRQGNQTKRVTVYQYDADGTFDTYKRMLVGKKSTWIDELLSQQGGNTVAVGAGLSREQMEEMIDSVGDSDAMSRMQARVEAAEQRARETSTQGRQAVGLLTIKAQREFLKKYPNPKAWAADKVAALTVLLSKIADVDERLANPKATASSLVKNQNLRAELQARADGLRRLIDESVVITKDGARQSIETFIANNSRYTSRGQRPSDAVAERLKSPYSEEVEVSEDGAIGNEWAAEVDMANALIEESQADFERLAGEPGGHSAEVLSRADAGEAAVIDGKVICTGALVESDGRLGFAKFGETSGAVVYFVDADGARREALADAVRKATVVLPGAAGYEAMVTRAAAIEDQLADGDEAQGPSMRAGLFSSVIPAVARQRKRELLIRYWGSGHRAYVLPSPLFPQVVQSIAEQPEGTRVARLLAEQQSKVVRSTDSGGGTIYFTADAAENIVQSDGTERFMWSAARDFAKARGVKFTRADFDLLRQRDFSSIEKALMNRAAADGFEAAVIAPGGSTGDLQQRLRTWLETEAFPEYDLSTDENFVRDPAEFLRSVGYILSSDYRRAVEAIEEAARRAANPAVVVPTVTPAVNEPEPADDGDDDDDPNRMVGISGDTKRWKDQIKWAATAVGGRAVWDRDALRWNVPFKAFGKLVESYPAAAAALSVVESSGKLSYGRRRRG